MAQDLKFHLFYHKIVVCYNQLVKLDGDAIKQCANVFINMYNCYKEMDCSMLEINPLVQTKQGQIVALDAKFNFDSNALFRHKDVLEMRDFTEENAMELEASKYNLNYIVAKKGNQGITVVGKDNFVKHIKAHPVQNPDVTGAGDTVIAALSIAYAKNQDIELSAKFANAAAAIVVGKAGTATATIEEIEQLFTK